MLPTVVQLNPLQIRGILLDVLTAVHVAYLGLPVLNLPSDALALLRGEVSGDGHVDLVVSVRRAHVEVQLAPPHGVGLDLPRLEGARDGEGVVVCRREGLAAF